MWTAGKYQGPKSDPAALIWKGKFCGSSSSPDEHAGLSPSALGHSYYTQISAKCLYMKCAGKDWTALYLAY